MPESDGVPKLVIWTDPDRAAACVATVNQLGGVLKTAAVGGPRSSAVEHLARDLGAPLLDDLRKLLNDHPTPWLLYAASQALSPADAQAIHDQGTTIVALEPVAADLDEWARLVAQVPSLAAGVVPLPAFLLSPSVQAAAEPLSVLGDLQSIAALFQARPGDASLLALLLDVWMTVLALGDLPESIDASLTGPYRQIPRDMRALTGHLHAHARLGDGRSAVIQVTDHAAALRRSLHVLGSTGQFEATDESYTLLNAAGQPVDAPGPAAAPAPQPLGALYPGLIAAQWRRLVDHIPAPDEWAARERLAGAIACSQATALSCRTGQPESPRRLLEMHLRA